MTNVDIFNTISDKAQALTKPLYAEPYDPRPVVEGLNNITALIKSLPPRCYVEIIVMEAVVERALSRVEEGSDGLEDYRMALHLYAWQAAKDTDSVSV